MIQKTNLLASETKTIERSRVHTFREYLLFHKIRALEKGILIPDNLIAELENFSERNSLAELSRNKVKCCPVCLKGHTCKIARDTDLEQNATSFLLSILEEKCSGHSGYYLDKGEIVKI